MGSKPQNLDLLVSDLQTILEPSRVRTDYLERALYSKDASLYSGEDPTAVCFPQTTQELADVVRVCHEHSWPFVARGSGTGLAGGANPLSRPTTREASEVGGAAASEDTSAATSDDADTTTPTSDLNQHQVPVVIATAKMNQILSVDGPNRIAWVQPGVLNLDLTRQVSHLGLHYAPDPSSQQVCSIGGNVATNSGGPHCLAYGVTSAHVIALKAVLPDGTIAHLGNESPEPVGYDLRGSFVGSEGTLGIAAEIAVRLTPNPPAIKTLLAVFDRVADGAATVSGIIAAGLVPSALEMMDNAAIGVVEAFVQAGLPTDAAAVLLIELDGLPTGLAEAEQAIRDVAAANNVREVRTAADAQERDLFWKARKSAFGAVSRLAPDYYLHDTVVPRTSLVAMLECVYEIASRHELKVCNVFHAGDGNLHPLLSFDSRDEGVLERVALAADEIVRASLAFGGVLTGEHGIGVEKRDHMGLMFTAADLSAQDKLRLCFDPMGLANPFKVIPSGAGCGDVSALGAAAGFNKPVPEGAWV